MRQKSISVVAFLLMLAAPLAPASDVVVSFSVPEFSDGPKQRPYVAIWLEKRGQKQAIRTFEVWYEDKKWLKDLRRWWRKSGRYQEDIDAITSATKPPGTYTHKYTFPKELLESGGKYTLYIEAVREHGNRTLLKQPIDLSNPLPQSFELEAGKEIGPINIRLGD